MWPGPSRTHRISAARVGARSGPPAHGPQPFPQAAAHLAGAQLAAQRGVLDIQQLAAHGLEEMEVAHQIRDRFERAARDGFRSRPAPIAHGGDQRPASGDSGLDRRLQLGGVLRGDPDRVQHPVPPAVQAQELPPAALVTGGVDVQRIARGHGGAQGRGLVPMQGFESPQEAIAQHRHGTGGQLDPAAGEFGANLAPLLLPVIAGTAHPDDQVVAELLLRRHEPGQLGGDRDRRGRAVPAALANLAHPDGAGRQCGDSPGLALLRLQPLPAVRAATRLGREIHCQARRRRRGRRPGPGPAAVSTVCRAPFLRPLREVEAGEHRAHLRPGDRRRMPLQAAGDPGRRRARVAHQSQQHGDDHRRFRRGRDRADALRVKARLARLPLGVADRGVGGPIDPDAGHALADQRLAADGGQQEGLHAHLQPGLQFLLRAAVGGLGDETAHGGSESAVAGEMHVAQGEQPESVEAQRIGVGVVAAVVVVAAQMGDLLEEAKGGGAGGIAEGRLELGEGDGSGGSQPCGQHVGGTLGHEDRAGQKHGKVGILYQTEGGKSQYSA